ncbi:MAG TPA: sulfotransferase [Allosphingosinicella sp.]|nr:sulfotransferase [Allosphingosinicella sp.]
MNQAQGRMRAYQLQVQGRLEEAAAAYRWLIDRDPADFESLNNLGNVHRAAGRRDDAVAALEGAVAVRPDLPMLRLNLAGALAEAGRLEDSLAAVAEAARIAPGEPACLVELARAHARLGDSEAALAELERAAALIPEDPSLQVEIGLTHAGGGRLAEAEAAYRRAIALSPGFAPAFLYLGILLEHSNRAEELGGLLAEAEGQRVPERELALVRAFSLRRQGDDAGALAAARSASRAFEPLRRLQLIAEMCDRLGDGAAAFEAFREMNRLAAAGLDSPGEAAALYRAEIERLLALTTAQWHSGWSPAAPPAARPSPIFLMGFPRSGTTLLDTVLMGHSRLHVVEERPLLQPVLEAIGDPARLADLTAAEIGELRDLYFATLDALDPPPAGTLTVDKMPLNIARLPIIHRLFPDARILFALRHPCDVVLSCFITNFGLNYAMANFLDLSDSARLYDLTMRYWERCREVFPLDVHEIRYEAIVDDLDGTVRPLLDFLGLDWEAGMTDHRRAAAARGYVASASYAQVTEPVYARARGRWRRYREEMADVLPVLLPWAERLGYDV